MGCKNVLLWLLNEPKRRRLEAGLDRAKERFHLRPGMPRGVSMHAWNIQMQAGRTMSRGWGGGRGVQQKCPKRGQVMGTSIALWHGSLAGILYVARGGGFDRQECAGQGGEGVGRGVGRGVSGIIGGFWSCQSDSMTGQSAVHG